MDKILITSEKPQAALRIATALADGNVKKNQENGVLYYEITHNGKNILIAAAVGHLFNLTERVKNGWTYPIFDVEWQPAFKVNKSSKFTKKYLDNLKKLSKEAKEYVNGCDVDLEGELIFKNILNYIYNKKDAKRMYFSTLTKEEIINAYEHASNHLNPSQAEAGETRHYLDYYWGINLSRALTLAIKNSTGHFKLLSSGRVQGPALKILVDKEREILSFKPTPFWQIEIKTDNGITALHKEEKFFDGKRAQDIFKKIKGNDAKVESITKKDFPRDPPHPFDLTAMQLEAYRTLRIQPKETLALAQNLYINGYISYPRTSSNQLPESLGYKKILQNIAKQSKYKTLAEELLKKPDLSPNNGKKTDPAHPALYITEEIPGKLTEREAKLYDLIVHRILATFAEKAIMETANISLNIKDEIFIASGIKTKIPGWHRFYKPYIKLKEIELPEVKENQILKVNKHNLLEKETQPPKRYTPASIIKELEKKIIGTKSTRAEIIDNLYQRSYIKNESIEVTNLGIKTIETLERFCPEIIDEELTRKFEEEMDSIQERKKKSKEVLEEAKDVLTKTLAHFKKNEKEIGKALSEANKETMDKEAFIGKCPVCKEGNLQIRRGKYGIFAACDRYEQGCSTTFALPKNAKVKAAEKDCDVCNYPKILVIKARKKPQELCINPNCEAKKQAEKKLMELIKGKTCPKCSSSLVIKNSVYGSFLACPNYPKCKHIEKIPKD